MAHDDMRVASRPVRCRDEKPVLSTRQIVHQTKKLGSLDSSLETSSGSVRSPRGIIEPLFSKSKVSTSILLWWASDWWSFSCFRFAQFMLNKLPCNTYLLLAEESSCPSTGEFGGEAALSKTVCVCVCCCLRCCPLVLLVTSLSLISRMVLQDGHSTTMVR